uniref:Polyhydroxyalkanoate synthesis regulator phasin n=1 Tax=Salinispora arenicola (strain CNS-205) TaxID=391037 RepID=A8LYS2_SALAI
MQDAWRSYLALAMGLTEAPRKKAQETARRLVGAGGATAVQFQTLAEEIVSTGAANRGALTKLVRFEVERALGAVGLATADEVSDLTRRVYELERQLREVRTGGPAALGAGGAETGTDTGPVLASGTAAGPTVQPTTTVPAATGKAPSVGATSPPTPAKKTVAKKAVAKKAVAKKAVAKKPVARKSVAVRPSTEMSPAPRPAKRTPRKQQPGGPA